MKKNLLIVSLLAGGMFLIGCGGGGPSSAMSNNNTSAEGIDLTTYDKPALTEDQKYSLAYMWHEEKLARDLYLELNKLYPTVQLEQIGSMSENMHISLVQDLVEWYDINITNLVDYTVDYSKEELDALGTGEFAVPVIQELYDTLYAKGSASKQDALETGCMVEVTDINDLDGYIATAGDNKALVDTFTILRAGSYNHYWAFDNALRQMGIADGCCSLGSEYCHAEYPQK